MKNSYGLSTVKTGIIYLSIHYGNRRLCTIVGTVQVYMYNRVLHFKQAELPGEQTRNYCNARGQFVALPGSSK